MKSIKIFTLFILVILFGCKTSGKTKIDNDNSDSLKQNFKIIGHIYSNRSDYYIVDIDSCEYIVYTIGAGTGVGAGICHKGNCKYCYERNKRINNETK